MESNKEIFKVLIKEFHGGTPPRWNYYWQKLKFVALKLAPSHGQTKEIGFNNEEQEKVLRRVRPQLELLTAQGIMKMTFCRVA